MKPNLSRRRVMRVTTALIATQAGGVGISSAIAQGGQSGAGRNDAAKDADQNGNMPDVTPPEDLMCEHGVLNRVLLIYETAMRKFADNERFDASVITQAAITSTMRSSRSSHAFAKPGRCSTSSTCSISNIKPGGA